MKLRYRRVVRSSLLECCQQGAFPGGELVLAVFLGEKAAGQLWKVRITF
jgi:hypothetical protein